MSRNEIILLVLCLLIFAFVIYLTVIVITNFVKAGKRIQNRIYNPNKLPITFYRKDEKGKNKVVPIEEVSESDLLIGKAFYNEDSIQFYIDDKRELNHK